VAGVKLFFAYFALLSYLIPLSLVVSLELVKVRCRLAPPPPAIPQCNGSLT
jgi:hypothetical protein